MLSTTITAEPVWKALQGIICVYKPADVSCCKVLETITYKLSSELNEMTQRPLSDHVTLEGDSSKKLKVVVEPNLADHPLVAGPHYVPQDFKTTWSSYLGKQTSGVLLVGIQRGTTTAMNIRLSKHIRSYRIKGQFGVATDNNFKDGKPAERSTYGSIKYTTIERLLASMQGAHQKKMFELSGVDMQSQTAYDLAVQGPIRPKDSKIPLLYGIKCVEFNLPDFTIEIHCVNEYEMYLKALIHEIGLKLHSVAHCTSVQCIRHSYFNLEHAILRKHWTLQNVIDNLQLCKSIIDSHQHMLQETSVGLRN